MTEWQCTLPPSHHPSLMQSKNYFVEIIQFLFYSLTKSIWNVFLRLLERLKCKNFKTMMVAVRIAYITVTINFRPFTFTDTLRALIKQIKVQPIACNVCNKVHCISTNSSASQPDTATSAYFHVFCGTFLRNHVTLISKKCCSKHLRITSIFILFLSTFYISDYLKI